MNARTGSQDLVLADLRKSYGGVVALDGATLVCSRGEVHGVVGENGAGKSTVVRILSGAVAADAGTIALDGTEIAIRSPADAHAAGIATVFQELSLIPHLGVAQNLFYGSEPRSILGRISTRRLAHAAGDAFDRFGLPRIDAHKPVYELRLAERQLLEILKALNRQPSVLVLDEPTSALLPAQVEWLFGAARRFAEGGGIVLFISHRLSEIEQLCDRVTVLRNGTHVGTGLVQELPEHTLVELMLGRRLERFFPDKAQHERVRDDVVCRLREFAAQPDLHELDLEVRAGQIVGVGGLEGQGQATLFRALFGLRSFTGTFELDGQSTHPRGPSRALARGIALVPEDRASEGLCLPLSVRDNISLSSLSPLSRAGLVVRTRERRLVAEARSRLAIKLRSPLQEVASLSGGNQQKVLLARTLATSPSLLLLYDATRGVDVGTKAEIYTLMHALCRDGVGILFYSTDAIELAGMSDRVIVLHDGRVRADLSGEEINEAALVAAAVGGGRKP